MGRTYYCEYCHRAFADTLPTRKRHIKSIQHQRARKLHYDSYKDSATLMAEEAEKTPCKIFFQTGQCRFGENCKFSHVNPEFLRSLTRPESKEDEHDVDMDLWHSEWGKKHPKKEPGAACETVKYWLPRGFPPLHELPPSLHPPLPRDEKVETAVEWGV